MPSHDLAEQALSLSKGIEAESDPRQRVKLCRQALGLGRAAVQSAEDLTDEEIKSIQSTLRLAHRSSKGTHNPNTSVTRLAKTLMERAGLTELDIIIGTRPRVIGTETATFAIADQEPPESWWDTKTSVDHMNKGRFFSFSTGADGGFSLTLRLIAGTELFLQPKEYKSVLEVSPTFHIVVATSQVFFGCAEQVSHGLSIPMDNGRYVGNITSFGSSRGPRFLATLIRSDEAVAPIHQVTEMKEL